MVERTTARVVLLNECNQILLLKSRHKEETFWLTPGGQIESHENALEAAQRELYEETGIDNATFITPYSYYSEATYWIKDKSILFKEYFFLAWIQDKEIIDYYKEFENQEVIEAKWWNLQEFIAGGETFYPRGLLSELEKVIYQKKVPQVAINVHK